MRSSQRLRIEICFATFASLLLLLAALALSFIAEVEGADRAQGARRLAAPTSSAAPGNKFKSPCGTSTQVSSRIGRCIDPIFGLVYGQFPDPKGDSDLVAVCNRFADAEKCVRNIAKECLTGLPRTATSSVASATRRFRTQECKTEASRARYFEPLRCSLKNPIKHLYDNFTSISQQIRDLPKVAPEEKLMKVCCMLAALDKAIEDSFNKVCPASTSLVLGILHAMTDDARSTLCVAPKCNHSLDKVVGKPYKPPQNLIEPVMEVLFMLNAD